MTFLIFSQCIEQLISGYIVWIIYPSQYLCLIEIREVIRSIQNIYKIYVRSNYFNIHDYVGSYSNYTRFFSIN